jgi:hypothetical protein
MSRRGNRLTTTEKQARRLQRDAQELDALVKDTGAAYRSSHQIAPSATAAATTWMPTFSIDGSPKSGARAQAPSPSRQPWPIS